MQPSALGSTDLPVEDCIDELRVALSGHGAAVLQAPPGAGKTTIVPLRLLDEAWLNSAGQNGSRIVVLEPRRLAARAAARRMAALLDEDVGETVGFRTRDERRVGPSTRVEVVTEGILIQQVQRDPELGGVGLVIFDEIHERTLQADLALALTLDVRAALRPDLRLLAMSATIETDRIAALIGVGGDAPTVRSEGRTFPVETRWRPPRPAASDLPRPSLPRCSRHSRPKQATCWCSSPAPPTSDGWARCSAAVVREAERS